MFFVLVRLVRVLRLGLFLLLLSLFLSLSLSLRRGAQVPTNDVVMALGFGYTDKEFARFVGTRSPSRRWISKMGSRVQCGSSRDSRDARLSILGLETL